MARFFASLPDLLGELYQPEGARRSADRIDLEGQIQLVHDVSRENITGKSTPLERQGWLKGVARLEHAASSTTNVFATVTYNSIIQAVYPDGTISSHRAWMVDASMTAPPDLTSTSGIVSLQEGFTALVGSLPATRVVTHFFNLQQTDLPVATGTGLPLPVVRDGAPPALVLLPRPLLGPGTAMVNFASRSTNGAGAGRGLAFVVTFWVGPLGALPPGVA